MSEAWRDISNEELPPGGALANLAGALAKAGAAPRCFAAAQGTALGATLADLRKIDRTAKAPDSDEDDVVLFVEGGQEPAGELIAVSEAMWMARPAKNDADFTCHAGGESLGYRLVPAAPAAKPQAIGPLPGARKRGEGPGNLESREEWFQSKAGHKSG